VPERKQKDREGKSGRKGAQSIHRAIALLRAVGRHNEQGVALSQIARESELHVATAHRMLSVLTQEGFITHDSISRRYHLGLELFLLAGSAQQFVIRNQFRRAMEEIAHETGDTVFLLIRSGNDALCIDRVEGKSPIRTVPVDIGARRPLGIGAGSIALTAFLPPDQVEAVLAANALRYPQFKNMTRKKIQTFTDLSCKVGFAISEGIFHEGVTSLGIPIGNERGEVVAAVTVSSTSQRMDRKRRQEILKIVKTVAKAEGFYLIQDLQASKKPALNRAGKE
jgi:DNA-binding IclR family transcriptional regulator